MLLTLSMASTWAQTAPALRGVRDAGEADRQRDHRQTLEAAVRGAVDALGGNSEAGP
jgi:hypothetical protein